MAANGVRPRIVLFGDSLTQRGQENGYGWASLLADAYTRKADIVNRGYSGYNTVWALHALEEIFPQGEPAPLLVTVFLGANDAALPDRGSARQHVPVARYRENLARIVAHVGGYGAGPKPCVVVLTPPPVDDDARVAFGRERRALTANRLATFGVSLEQQAAAEGKPHDGLPERTNAFARGYAQAALEVAREAGAVSVDLWTDLQADPGWKGWLNDGLHFTPEGNKRVFELLMEALERSAPGALPASLPWDYPGHDALGVSATGAEGDAAAFAEFARRKRDAAAAREAKGDGWWKTAAGPFV